MPPHAHPHPHGHGELFPAAAASKLDDPARLKSQPPKAIVDALALTPGCRVLDFGAGTGYYALPIAERIRELGDGGKVIAVDRQREMLEHLEAKLAGRAEGVTVPIETLEGSVEAVVRLDPGSVDRVLLASVLHEVSDRRALFMACARALVVGGMILVVDWHPDGSQEHGPPRDHRLLPEDVSRWIGKAGFEQIEALPCYPDHFVLHAIRTHSQAG